MDWVGQVLSAISGALPGVGAFLSPLTVPVIAAVAVVAGAVLGTQRAARIAAGAQNEIAKVNAATAQDIARINAENAQKVEQIKAESQQNLERDKFNREWRRDRVKPLLDKLEELRKQNMGVFAAVLSGPMRMSQMQAAASLGNSQFTIYPELISVCPPELRERLQVLLEAQQSWIPGYIEWTSLPIEKIEPMSKSPWYPLFMESLEAAARFARTIDDYVYADLN